MGQTLESFDQGIFNLMWHLKEKRDDIMSWPHAVKVDVWKRYLSQLEFEKKKAAEND